MTEYVWVLLVALGLLISQMLIKQGMRQMGEISITSAPQAFALLQQALGNYLLIFGLGLSGLVGLVWLGILSRMDLSHAAPMLGGIYYGLLLIASALILGETVGPLRWVGGLLVISGITLLAVTK
jgi:drug/metabolite transporter (DMT)-like permease